MSGAEVLARVALALSVIAVIASVAAIVVVVAR